MRNVMEHIAGELNDMSKTAPNELVPTRRLENLMENAVDIAEGACDLLRKTPEKF